MYWRNIDVIHAHKFGTPSPTVSRMEWYAVVLLKMSTSKWTLVSRLAAISPCCHSTASLSSSWHESHLIYMWSEHDFARIDWLKVSLLCREVKCQLLSSPLHWALALSLYRGRLTAAVQGQTYLSLHTHTHAHTHPYSLTLFRFIITSRLTSFTWKVVHFFF